jgi:hypothetical protein
MKKPTISNRIATALVALGCVQIKQSVLLKGGAFAFPDRPDDVYYVGNGGSLRMGRTKADSIPMDLFKAELLKKFEEGAL